MDQKHRVRFVLDFNMYLFLAQCEQIRLFLALAVKKSVQGRTIPTPR